MSYAPAVFLDKDGTIVENVPDNVDAAKLQPTPGALFAARRLHDAGYRLVIVTNQGGVARGAFSERALRVVEARLRALFALAGAPLAGFYYCPHDPDGCVREYAIECDCRKPRPGLLRRAALEQELDLPRSWFVGDILHDVEAGRAAGCRTVLIDNGNETEWKLTPQRLPHHVAPDMRSAASIIVKEGRPRADRRRVWI